ncbi:MAG TPA: RluA family pseudouridine synthase [Planctomycetota bacterium]|nr:RluA family pseudouridine synthase [Planctomycetota bacterium]
MRARSDQVLVVAADLAGSGLADFLESSLPPTHRLVLRDLIASGRVKVNGEICLSSRKLREGDVVQLPEGDRRGRATKAPATPEVRYESRSVLVIDKPPGLATVPGRSGSERSIHGGLAGLRPADDLRIVHRLDRDTSGCLLLGKGVEAARHFDEQFRQGLVAKTYVALVHGVPVPERFSIDAWLGPDPRRPGKVVAAKDERKGFREAHTGVQRTRAFRRHALLALHPTTGRGHQLRVHLQSVGHPIVGDRDYGGEPLLLSSLKTGYKRRPGVRERPLVDRLFLHAERVSFCDLDGTQVTVETPLPEDLAVALQKLEDFDERRR